MNKIKHKHETAKRQAAAPPTYRLSRAGRIRIRVWQGVALLWLLAVPLVWSVLPSEAGVTGYVVIALSGMGMAGCCLYAAKSIKTGVETFSEALARGTLARGTEGLEAWEEHFSWSNPSGTTWGTDGVLP